MTSRTISLLLVVGALACVLSSGIPPPYEPFQLVRPNEDHTGFEVVSESMTRLLGAAGSQKIAVVSVVGPYHSGKSFLLNALIGRTSVFSVGPKTSPETMGLWMVRTDITLADHPEVEVWFVDSEGFFGPKVPESYDAKVFTLSMLLGDEFVYNTVKIIDAQAVGLLEMLARRAQLFRTKSGSGPAPGEASAVSDKIGSLPHLTWVVEDFVQIKDIDPTSSTRWLESYLDHDDSSGIPYLRRIFPDLTVQALFLPATSREQLSDLSRVPFANLTADFRKDLAELKSAILARLDSRKTYISLKDFGQTVYFLGNTLDKGHFPELPSLWNSWQTQVAATSLNDASELFSRALETKHGIPGRSEFHSLVSSAHEASLTLFRELVKDFSVGSESAELESRMRTRFAQTVSPQWTESVRKFVQEEMGREFGKFVAETKKFNQHSDGHVLFEPQWLHAQLATLSAQKIGNFSLTVSKYEDSVSPLPPGWPDSVYPSFNTSPLNQLRKELQAQVDTILVKNEKAVHEMIKSVGLTSAAAVDQLVSVASSKLFDRVQFEEFANEVLLKRGLSQFDSELVKNGGEWMSKVSPQYEAARKKLESEIREKIHKFKSHHHGRLLDWMNKHAEKALNVYRDQVATIAVSSLPADETALAKSHARAVEVLVATLDTDLGAKAYANSEAYESTRARLNSIVEAEFSKLSRKNIELWKVHSDSATHCALEANQRYTAEHCPQGWFCLFKVWPPSHKALSRAHLMHCFEGKNAKAPPESVRAQIFESWYEKDLAKNTAEVRFNMWVALVSMIVPALWILYIRFGPH